MENIPKLISNGKHTKVKEKGDINL
jgi:hypothetical protein